MKTLRLLIVTYCLLMAISSSAQTLTFRMANPNIFHNTIGGFDLFRFDIQVKASVAGTFIGTGQAKISFNPLVLSNVLSHWTIVNAALVSGTATIIDPNTGDPKVIQKFSPNFGAIGSDEFLVNWLLNSELNSYAPSAAYFNEVPTVWTTIISLRARITGSVTDVSANSFIAEAMDAQNFYQAAANTQARYSVAYSDVFSNLYIGRIFANNVWTQVGGTLDWTASVGTSVWDGTAATIPTTGVSLASSLRVHSPATLTIPPTGQLTVTEETDVQTANGLTIQASPANSGSLITGTATGTGSSVVESYMTSGAWHIAASSVSQTIGNFLTANTGQVSPKANIATNGSLARGMMDYNAGGNAWNTPAFTTSSGGAIGAGKGFLMRSDANGTLTFPGALQAGATVSVTGLTPAKWNCVGNPYSSAIGVNINGGTAQNFLTANSGNIDGSFGGLYIWDNTDASGNNGQYGKYTVINNTPVDLVIPYVQRGQAFMVLMNGTSSAVSFTSGMQLHNPLIPLKSANTPWPVIKLDATVNTQVSTTYIAFNSAMTKGLDPTYDGGLLKGGADLLVYSKLVEDTGIPFAIQALPTNDISSMVIPIGLDFKTGGEVVFSARLTNLPANCKVILEDKLTKTFTDLSKDTYKVTVLPNSVIADRFQLHTSDLSSSIVEGIPGSQLNAYAVSNVEIRIIGELSSTAVATLYDVNGKTILIKNSFQGALNIMPTPNLKPGLYLLSVKDGEKSESFKLLIRQ